MGRAFWILALPAVAIAQNTGSKTHAAKLAEANHTYNSDNEKLQTAMQAIDKLADDLASADKTNLPSKTLAKQARSEAHASMQADVEQARKEYNTALSALQSADPSTKYTAQEKAARQKLERLNRLEEEEEGKATRSLRDQEHERQEGVLKTFRQAREAATTLLKDRNSLEDAEEHDHYGEMKAEKEEMRHEFYAERLQGKAERRRDDASKSVQTLFEQAEHRLHDMYRQERQAATQRHQAVDDAVEKLQAEASTANQQFLAGLDVSAFTFNFYFLAAASVGLLLVFVAQIRARPSPVAQPLLG